MKGLMFVVGAYMAMILLVGLGSWVERERATTTFGVSVLEAQEMKNKCEETIARNKNCVVKISVEEAK